MFSSPSFPASFENDVPIRDFPLFPDESGSVVSKGAMTETIRQAATRLDIPLASPDGSERVSGHSLRVSGAQGLIDSGGTLGLCSSKADGRVT